MSRRSDPVRRLGLQLLEYLLRLGLGGAHAEQSVAKSNQDGHGIDKSAVQDSEREASQLQGVANIEGTDSGYSCSSLSPC